jgi:DNA polymerase III alpha subunit
MKTNLELYFEWKCFEGLKARGLDNEQYRKQLNYEIEIIEQKGFPGYFLVVQDLFNWTRRNDIYFGPGRGSVVGSLIAYCLGITNLDPIKYGLIFERFINPGRMSPPDIDMDFEKSRREDVVKYVSDKYGKNCVSGIGTIGTMKAKQAIQRVCKVLGYSLETGLEIRRLLLPPKAGKPTPLKDSIEAVPELQLELDAKSPKGEILKWALKFEDRISQKGAHACFTGDSLLWTDQGQKEIKSLVGQEVIIATSDGWKRGTVIDSGLRQICQMTWSYSKFSSRKRTTNLTLDQLIKIDDGWIKAKNSINSILSLSPMQNLDLIDELAGWFWNDGGYRLNVGIICFNTKKDYEAQIRFSSLLNSQHKGAPHKFNLPIRIIHEIEKRFKNGFKNLRHVKGCPEFNSLSSKIAWLRGMFSANATVQRGSIRLKLTSKALCQFIRDEVDSLGFTCSHLSECHSSPIIKGKKVNSRPSFQFEMSTQSAWNFANLIGFIQSYKQKKILSQKIQKIEIKDIQPTYDFSIIDEQDFNLQNGYINGILVHNSGIIITDHPISETAPLQRAKGDQFVSQWDMGTIEEVGLVKFDFLGLKTLDKMHYAIDIIRERTGKQIDINSISPDDPKVFDFIQKGQLLGIFQLEGSQGITDLSVKVKPKCLEDLSAILAIFRPGPLQSSGMQDYLHWRAGASGVFLIPEFEEILKETGGFIIYQEQVLEIARKLAKYNYTEADNFRRCVDGETLFNTKDGLRKISWLAENSKKPEILTLSNYEYKYNQARTVFSSGFKDTIKVITDSGTELICTPDHRVFTNYGWMEAKDLNSDCFLLHCIEENFGSFKIEEDILFLIIALITEGYCPEEKNSWYFCNSNEFYIKKFSDICSRFLGFIPNQWKQNNTYYVSVPLILRNFLELHGLIPGLSRTKKLPQDFLRLTRELTLKMLGWLIDFDGYVAFNVDGSHEMGYSSRSKELAKQIKIIMENCGLRSLFSKTNVKNEPQYLASIRDIKDLKIIVNLLIPYSIKCKDISFREQRESFTCHNVPHNIWFPIIENLINNSGFSRNNILSGESGRYFSKSITKVTLKKMLSVCGRSKALEFYCGDNNYWDRVRSIKDNGKIQVFDFTMSSEVTPCAFGNNLLIHNSIGKKKVDIIKKEYEKFQRGWLSSSLAQEKLDIFWAQLLGFADYLFNKSHSMAYGFLSYQTAYLKTYFPVEFLTACMIQDATDLNQMTKYLGECKRMGIRVLPPDINRSSEDFIITDQNEIQFGLLPIKGIGVGTVKEIMSKRRSGRPYKDIQDFCDRVNLSKVNRKHLEALVNGGAFDFSGQTRASLINWIDRYWAWMDLNDSYQKKMETFSKRVIAFEEREKLIQEAQIKLAALLETPGVTKEQLKEAKAFARKPKLKKPERPEIIETPSMIYCPEQRADLLRLEHELLGFFVSGHPLEKFPIAEEGIDAIDTLKDSSDGFMTKIRCVPILVKDHVTKAKKEKMVFVELEDQTGRIEGVMFPKAYSKYGKLLQPLTPCIVTVRVEIVENEDEEGEGSTRIAKIQIQKVETLDTGASMKKISVTPAKLENVNLIQYGEAVNLEINFLSGLVIELVKPVRVEYEKAN